MNIGKVLRITGFLVLGTLAIHSQSQGEKIDLEFAVASALKGHPRIKQMETAVQKSEKGKDDAFGNFLPDINLGYSFTHLNGPISIDLNPIRDAMITLQSKNQAEFANIYRLIGGGAPLTDAQKSSLAGNYATQLNSLLPEFKSTLKKQDYWTATITGVQPLFTGGKILAANNIAGLTVK
ncbi:MAG: TolC family protein [Ignavibacteriales bacterium]|nr:TolC family protein [Ignavibacteriales bacterium]